MSLSFSFGSTQPVTEIVPGIFAGC